jgi:hypothetical protein
VAVKKEKAEKKDEDKKKRDDQQSEGPDEDEFLDGPVVMQPLSEGDMGRHLVGNDDGKEVSICTRNILSLTFQYQNNQQNFNIHIIVA